MNDILPHEQGSRAREVYLVTNLGLSDPIDYFCLGTVFTIQVYRNAHWQTIFRRALLKKDSGWQYWEIPLGPVEEILKTPLHLRFVTDNYSRAFDRSWPNWKWAFWGQPQLVHYEGNSEKKVLYDFYTETTHSRCLIVLDKDGAERPFDQQSEDSTGAAFKAIGEGGYAEANAPSPRQPVIAAFPPYKNGLFGFTIAEFDLNLKF